MNNMEQLEADFDTELTAGNLKNGMKDAGASSGDLWKVPVENLRIIENFNVRVHNEKYEVQIEALKNSMMSEGFYQHEPLAGYVAKDDAGKDLVYIFGGHTRLLALQRANNDGAGIKVVPVVVGNKKGMSMDDMNIALINGNLGNPLSPYEQAVVCKRQVGRGMEVSEIARRTGFSVEWVNNLLLVMSAPLKLREMVANGRLSATLAAETVKKEGKKALEKVEAAVLRATAEGKPGKITKKHLQPTNRFDKEVKKSAPVMYTALEAVRKDPQFDSLSAATRETLMKLMADLDEKKEIADVDHSSQKTIFDAAADAQA